MDAWQKFIDGNDAAITSIYERYSKKMAAYGIALGFSEHVCKDAVHDVFCTLCFCKNKFNHVENVEVYLLQCLKNRLFDIYKEEVKINYIECNDTIIDDEKNVVDKITDEENLLLINEEVERLLKKLKPNHQKIIRYRFQLNLKFEEIALLMDMTPDAVKKQLYRSLKLMEQEREITLEKFK